MTPKAIVLCSGGMDSVTLAHMCAADHDLTLVSFDYGQRHVKEIPYAAAVAGKLGAHHTVVDMAGVGKLFTGSALTDARVDVPNGHYAAENMLVTVVPNRNMIMLSIAFGIAVSAGAEKVAAAMHAGDHHIYPDCRPAFLDAYDSTQKLAIAGLGRHDIDLYTPFQSVSKSMIVTIGETFGVDWRATWSCYNGRDLHCGTCGTCVERREAFFLAGIDDPTEYEVTSAVSHS